jgi:hypothetical protein
MTIMMTRKERLNLIKEAVDAEDNHGQGNENVPVWDKCEVSGIDDVYGVGWMLLPCLPAEDVLLQMRDENINTNSNIETVLRKAIENCGCSVNILAGLAGVPMPLSPNYVIRNV